MKYEIVTAIAVMTATAIKELEEKVNKKISSGWKPIGGISIDDGRASQAMIKEDE